jgi:Ca-activated chloride channel family protein
MNFSHPHFADPRWLWLAILGPLMLAALYGFSAWARQKQLAQFASPLFIEELTRSHSPVRRGIKQAFLLLAVAIVGLAMARPQWGQREESGQMLGEDVLFILDCSRSMLATDVTPSRLQRARLAILDFVHRRGRSRVGLVAFAGQAFLQCPLTFDYGAFEDSLMAMDDKTIPILGTDVGTALEEGFRAMDKGNERKLMVLLTDGEDLEKSGIRIAESLARQGAIIYTIGIGTPAGSEIQIVNDQGKPELLRDNKGEVVHSRLDEATLRRIAQATHGDYFPLGPLGEGLAKVQLELEKISTLSGSSPARKLGVDRFYLFVAAALFLLVADSLIGTRRRLSEVKTV